MYDSPAELLRAISAGEDSLLELKELVFEGRKIVAAGEGQASSWLARQLCAFANSDGGVLVLGVADSKAIVGLEPDRIDEVQQFVANVGRENVEPPLDHLLLIDSVQLPVGAGERLVVKVEIRPDFYAVHAPRGARPTVRSGNTTREVSMEALPRLLTRRGSITPVDERPVLSATVDDLDRDAIAAYHQERFGRPADDLDRLMRNLKLMVDDDVSGSHPTVAGLLVFGRNPQAHIDGARIDIAAYEGDLPDTDRRLDSRSFGGPILSQIDQTTAYLGSSPLLAVASSKDHLGRLDRPTYSLRAVQEAVVNAVAHRDYALVGAQVRVQVFSDRIEVTSPGRLPNSLVPEDLFAGAQPLRRNQVLVGFLTHMPGPWSGRVLMESMGEGFLTMVRESEELSGRRPELRLQTEAVTVIIFAASARTA